MSGKKADSPLRIALVGNPNCGKTTLFNALTGSRQAVGNWPGVTVEWKAAPARVGKSVIVDLPGIYSLAPRSEEERVARGCLLKPGRTAPDALINILDGTNLERSLYLTLQLLELGIPCVVAVNLMDEVTKRGWEIDCEKLTARLGVPVLPVSARSGENILPLLKRVEEKPPPVSIEYDPQTEAALEEICKQLKPEAARRHIAARLLAGEPDALSELGSETARARAEQVARRYGDEIQDAEIKLADARYRLIEKIIAESTRKPRAERVTLTDRIDRAAMGKWSALPLFFLLLGGVFALTFGPAGRIPGEWIARFFSQWLIPFTKMALRLAHAPPWCEGLLTEGVLGGISGVLVFLPQIALLFFCLSALEDSGYLARAAFLLDWPLKKIGLTGRSFIPLLLGFGCTTTAVMAARGLPGERDRRLTIMLTPFMSCSARLPIYVMFAGAFFSEWQAGVVLGLYLLGVGAAAAVSGLLQKSVFCGKPAPFLMELPPYRLPQPAVLLRQVWERVRGFLVKAGTLILAVGVLLWAAQAVSIGLHPWELRPAEFPAESILGRIGLWLAPLFAPLGFGTWQAAVALLAGLVAKESVIGSLTILYAGGTAALLPAALTAAFSPAAALSFMVFSLLYMPCISAFATIARELGGLRWALATAALQGGVAWLAAFLVYQTARLL